MQIEHQRDLALAGNQRALSRVATLIENHTSSIDDLILGLREMAGQAHVVGVTGSPGAGKSSLLGEMARLLLQQGHRVAVIAVDPSSQLSGGATLGDRIRLSEVSSHPNFFLRSMATRSRQDGLSPTIVPIIQLFDAAGYDVIFLETVGAGQNQTEIKQLVHTLLLIEAPGAGDSVQMLKAGLMELADIYVVNKSDLAGAQLLSRDLRANLALDDRLGKLPGFKPKVLLTSVAERQGIDQIIDEITRHREWLASSGKWNDRSRRIALSEIRREMDQQINAALLVARNDDLLISAVSDGKLSPAQASSRLLAEQLAESEA